MRRKGPTAKDLDAMWSLHSADWRDPAQATAHWHDASTVDPQLLEEKAYGPFWDLLEELSVTLLVTREYEHLVMAMSVVGGRPRSSYLPLPHPSGLVADRQRGEVHIASTRNPNQVFTLKPATGRHPREDQRPTAAEREASERVRPLLPVRAVYYPGFLYMHDLALVGGKLYANSVGQNAVVELSNDGSHRVVWWPKSLEEGTKPTTPRLGRNFLQLNSIAAGESLKESFFSASSARPGRYRPGHLRYPVDGKGVIFSGKTREPIAAGLTRPHSARLHQGRVWVDNSGYGQVGFIEDGRLRVVATLPGWTRGLCFVKDYAFVATSRVIPKYARYAPGLDTEGCLCGIHAIDLTSGKPVAYLAWPYGNQVFAIDWLSARDTGGFPFESRGRVLKSEQLLFYAYSTERGVLGDKIT